jgi:Spy/CpxP family protein refolding chaperone
MVAAINGGTCMKMKLLVAAAMAFALPAMSADPQATAEPVNQSSAGPGLSDEQVVQQFRSDMMAKRADIMAKGLTLTADQASKFWPQFEQYQKEQDVIVNEQINATKAYADHYKALSDADATAYVKALLDRDQKMLNLRVKWLEKFQKVVPAKIAARAIQLDRRVSNVAQVQLSSQIPLVH